MLDTTLATLQSLNKRKYCKEVISLNTINWASVILTTTPSNSTKHDMTTSYLALVNHKLTLSWIVFTGPDVLYCTLLAYCAGGVGQSMLDCLKMLETGTVVLIWSTVVLSHDDLLECPFSATMESVFTVLALDLRACVGCNNRVCHESSYLFP